MLAPSTPDFRLFWTAYDPLDLASGSIDVLGLQAGYIALANKLVPGFTTVTTSPRYVTMLCAAVASAEAAWPGAGAPSVRIREVRLAAVKSYERAWALACALAATDAAAGDRAVDGLRGIQSVRRRLNELSGRESSIRTRSLNLLANQVRYGGIGAYSSMLEDCHLASMRSVTLRTLGARLAGAFPSPDDLAVWDEDKPLLIDALREWGLRCHLGGFTPEEGKGLTTALRGGDESGWEDDVRWTTLRLVAAAGKEDQSEPDLLETLLAGIRRGDFERLNAPPECLRQIEAALVLISPYERLSQAVQFLFDAVRAAATDEPEVHVEALAPAPRCASACQGARNAATALLAAITEAATAHHQTAHDVRQTFVAGGVVALAEAIRGTPGDTDLLELILDRHRDVQQGKFDRGERKAAWVRRETAGGAVRLTAQRYHLPKSDRYDAWEQLPWHPYRTFGARRFVRACKIR